MARLKKLKAETPPQKVILEYLEKNVSESLAERINSGDKTFQGCWNYIVKQAKQEAQNGNLRQAYGDHDSKPAEDILIFVEGEWLPFAKAKMKE